jgi:RluA family pseudouridine synthase
MVGPDEEASLGELLARLGVPAAAVAEGRVFIGRRRAREVGERVERGDEVRWSEDAAASAVVPILFADEAIVVADKPAGIPTIPDHAGARGSLLHLAAEAAGVDAASLHPTSRLDREVSGVVIFARTQEAARALADARSRGAYERRYVALASRAPSPATGSWDAPIGRAKDPRRRAARGKDAVPARTRYSTVAATAHAALLALAPETGRTHQIRVHASDAGAPLLGDKAYGGPTRITLPSGRVLGLSRVALHCARVVVPLGAGPREIVSPVPAELADLWVALGGEPPAWDLGARCAL